MPFDTDRFWPAFRRAGMLKTVQVVSPAGVPDFDGRIEAPTGLFADGMVQVDEVTLEYPSATPVDLAHGSVLQCNGRTYKVMALPERLQDGWLTRVKLKETKA
ncbi:hypothetical protein [Ralstonia pseudosolanacearum]|uniref:hypothetical protein n=1 Tax=Ralstonia pseudosolanacearum TaxID=1310165 RepID=UPI000E593F61|nr:hypothetical protein [Ralstonia pseudosolanacearum]AXW48127.1 hypothetical protein CJO91_10695 [Ralstonia solanacearum]MDO3524508.1 hypothetical protein [Ralstonia pseudosolanacearum]MDO3552408.1 hypothetical protein [Ralstonia pseudosolanacearum]MDO3591229.1 hypothetical protein [Ralstonia pseudosolanacearum]MDO3595719.1 hypothetical protein [Ralstonia pseudosolanacearum]